MSSPFTYHSTAAVTDRTWHICGTFYLCPPLGQESHHSWGQHCRRWVLISATGQGWLWVVRLALILVVFSGGGNDAGELDGWPILWAGKVRAEATLPPSTCRSAVETKGQPHESCSQVTVICQKILPLPNCLVYWTAFRKGAAPDLATLGGWNRGGM